MRRAKLVARPLSSLLRADFPASHPPLLWPAAGAFNLGVRRRPLSAGPAERRRQVSRCSREPFRPADA